MVTLGEWLHTHNDTVPSTLRDTLDTCIDSHEHTHDDVLGVLSKIATTQTMHMRDQSGTTRDDARTVLVTDALVTYTLELAAAQGVPDLGTFAGGLLQALTDGPRDRHA